MNLAASSPSPTFEFGRCQVVVTRRELLYEGRAVSLGERAFDILVALVEARGTVVGKDHLIERAWPGRVIEENTLEAQVSALRRALGEDRNVIRTVAGRGYQFVGDLLDSAARSTHAAETVKLPVSVTPIVGREEALREILELAADNRLITLVGAGGVGKTRLALEAARQLAARFPDGVSLAELGPLSESEYVPAVVAEALGFPQSAGTPSLERIASAISGQRLLLVLDNCEHLIEAAAQMAERLLHAGAFVCILATSRESLKAEGEYVYRVASLDVPLEENQDIADLRRYGALQLFNARAGAPAGAGKAEDPALTLLKARICRQLDGIPLAIELAAARVRVFGVQGVADRIDDRFGLLTGGARTALPRQKTLRATLDWSYELLSPRERDVLARLSIFAGPFSIESAAAVASCPVIPQRAVVDTLADLVEKSLVSVDAGTPVLYRLLETTQVYAREKLQDCGELPTFARRQGQHYCELMTVAEREWNTRPTAQWTELYAPHLENLRAAINWSFRDEGDAALGVALTTAALPLWLQLALLEECLARVDVALGHLDAQQIDEATARMKLYAARGAALLYQGAGRKTSTTFERAFELAERQADAEYLLRATWGLWSVRYLNGDYPASLVLAQRFSELARRRAPVADQLVGDRLTGLSLLCLGRLADARDSLEKVVTHYVRPKERSHLARFIYEQAVVANSSQAHVLWLQGFADQAAVVARRAMDDANAADHPPSICYALTESVCPIALLAGGAATLSIPVASAVEATRRHGVSTWKARGHMWQGLLQLSEGDAQAYERDLLPAFDEIGDARFVLHYTGFVSAVCDALGRLGRRAQAAELVTQAIARARGVGDACSLPELLRVHGELLALDPAAQAAAEAQLLEAMEASRLQQALAWQLRCATSLARRWVRAGKREQAIALLQPVFAQFSEGFDTVDLKAAQAVLESAR